MESPIVVIQNYGTLSKVAKALVHGTIQLGLLLRHIDPQCNGGILYFLGD